MLNLFLLEKNRPIEFYENELYSVIEKYYKIITNTDYIIDYFIDKNVYMRSDSGLHSDIKLLDQLMYEDQNVNMLLILKLKSVHVLHINFLIDLKEKINNNMNIMIITYDTNIFNYFSKYANKLFTSKNSLCNTLFSIYNLSELFNISNNIIELYRLGHCFYFKEIMNEEINLENFKFKI